MGKWIKLNIVVVLLLSFLFFKGIVVHALPVGSRCGTTSYYTLLAEDERKCNITINSSCNVKGSQVGVACFIDKNGDCMARYEWARCYKKKDPTGGYYCSVESNSVLVPCDQDGGGGGGGSYEPIRCNEGQYVSCGTDSEAIGQNKSFCTYYKTCNKYYFASTYNFPQCKTTPEGNPLYTCRTNCSCCDMGTERTCTLGATYTNTVSIYVGGADPVDAVNNQLMKDTCYQNGVKRRDHIVEKITFIRSYSKKDNTEWQDWQQNCRVQNCSCKAPPTPTLTPQNKQRPADGKRTPAPTAGAV